MIALPLALLPLDVAPSPLDDGIGPLLLPGAGLLLIVVLALVWMRRGKSGK